MATTDFHWREADLCFPPVLWEDAKGTGWYCRYLSTHGDPGMLVYQMLDDALGLTQMADDVLEDWRMGNNIQDTLKALLRQAVWQGTRTPATPSVWRLTRSCTMWWQDDPEDAGYAARVLTKMGRPSSEPQFFGEGQTAGAPYSLSKAGTRTTLRTKMC